MNENKLKKRFKMSRTIFQVAIYVWISISLLFSFGCSKYGDRKSVLKAAASTAVIIEGPASPLRAQVIIISEGKTKVCMGSCDIGYISRNLSDEICNEVEGKYGIPFNNIMLSTTNNHSGPAQNDRSDKTADQTFNLAIKKAVIEAIGQANEKLDNAGEMDCYFALGDATIGQNSRLVMEDGAILWAPTEYKFGYNRPTGPYDSQLPVLAFKDVQGNLEALIFNHSSQNIDSPIDRVLSPSFYGTASQKIEKELGGTVVFFIGAYGSTNVFDDCPNSERVYRVEEGIKKAYAKAEKRDIHRLVSVKKEFEFKYRTYNEAEQQKAVSDYCNRWLNECTFWHPVPEEFIQEFKNKRDHIANLQGKAQKTWIQVVLVGDIAFVGVPGGLFAELGSEIKRLSPFRYTYVVGLANDYMGYFPDNEAFDLGGYQTWANAAISERGTGEAIVNEIVRILNDLCPKK
jgi:hypothetical protein